MAKENAPAIIFIDEVDAIATSRFDAQTGADRYEQMLLCLARCFSTLLCIINLHMPGDMSKCRSRAL